MAFGVRCNSDDLDGAFCRAPGSVVVPFSTEVIKNKAMWSTLRLGGELKATLWNRLTVAGEAAILPVAYVVNEDSHLLRTDLGRPPNIEDRGMGWKPRCITRSRRAGRPAPGFVIGLPKSTATVSSSISTPRFRSRTSPASASAFMAT